MINAYYVHVEKCYNITNGFVYSTSLFLGTMVHDAYLSHHSCVNALSLAGWFSIFPFSDSLLTLHKLGCRLSSCLMNKITLIVWKVHTKYFFQACMCLHIHKSRSKRNIFHTLQQCNKMSSAARIGNCFFSSSLCKCPMSPCTHVVSWTWRRTLVLRVDLSLNCPGHQLQEQANVSGEHSQYYTWAAF
jgi:hypothetical protein